MSNEPSGTRKAPAPAWLIALIVVLSVLALAALKTLPTEALELVPIYGDF